jgi:hypothetical protein
MPNGEITYVQGSGFKPNTDSTIESQRYDEKHHNTAKAQPDGSYFGTWMPYVSGKKSGETVIEVKSKPAVPGSSSPGGSYHLE